MNGSPTRELARDVAGTLCWYVVSVSDSFPQWFQVVGEVGFLIGIAMLWFAKRDDR